MLSGKEVKALLALLVIAGLAIILSACNRDLVLDQRELELKVGETAVLKVLNVDADELEWNSSDASVAKVDQTGKVKAVGPGTVVITAKAGEKTAASTIVVNAALSLTVEHMWLGAGETRKAVVNHLADGEAAVWTSEGPDIAKVDQAGNITGVSPGSVKIQIATSEETAKCAVTVFAVSPDELFLTAREAVQTEIDPGAGSKAVTWTSGDSKIAVVNELGTVTGIAPGMVTITATIAGGKAACEVTVLGTLPDSLVLRPGDTQQVQLMSVPDGEAVVWRSEDPGIAKVDQSGIVTAVGLGTTRIIAATAGKEVVCGVTVPVDISAGKISELSGRISRIESFSPDGKMFLSAWRHFSGSEKTLMDLEGNEYALPSGFIPDEEGIGYGIASWRGTKFVYGVKGGIEAAIYIYDTKDHSSVNITEDFKKDSLYKYCLAPGFTSENTVSLVLPDGLWNYDINRQSWSHVQSFQAENIWTALWSPDFQKIAWIELVYTNPSSAPKQKLVTMDIESRVKNTILEQWHIFGYAWSQDSNRLAVVGSNQDSLLDEDNIKILPAQGGTVIPFTEISTPLSVGILVPTVSWVPGQNMVAYNTEDGLVIRNVSDGARWLVNSPIPDSLEQAQNLPEHEDVGLSSGHTWLKNGNLVTYSYYSHVGRNFGTLEIFEVDWKKIN